MSKQTINKNDLFEFAKTLSHQTDFQEILRLVAHQSSQILKADQALILMVNPDTHETIKTIMRDGQSIEKEDCREIYTNVGGWIIHYKKSFSSRDIHKDKRFSKGIFKGINVKSIIGVPLIAEDIIIGALILLYKDGSKHVDPAAVAFLENLAAISAPCLRNIQKIRQYFNTAMSEPTLINKYKKAGLIGRSSKFKELLHAIDAVAKCDVRVLLDGKTGTGKELIARAIHKFSSRSDKPFIAIDCGAIPATLLESELFGHTRGAFTGANTERQGLFLKANGGTLFMDEINNLPYELQSKLLRVLEEKEIRPVGSDTILKTDVRIIAASSVSLKELVNKKQFREDLFFRLHVYPIYIPDLFERKDDIPLLATHFLKTFALEQGKSIDHFHEDVITFMNQRTWNGNIRELLNFVERLVTLSPKEAFEMNADCLPADLQGEYQQFCKEHLSHVPGISLKEEVQRFEAQLIKQTLVECNWNQSETARRLKTSEKNIRYKMNLLNIKK